MFFSLQPTIVKQALILILQSDNGGEFEKLHLQSYHQNCQQYRQFAF